MKLSEIFNSPIPASKQYNDPKLQTYVFSVDNINYEILIGEMHPGDWEVSFDAELSPGRRVDYATGTGNEVKVFSTVYNYVNQFLSKRLPDVNHFKFTSDLESRSKLYRRLATMWAKNNNMTMSHGTNQYDETEFVLVNPNYQK